MKLILVLAIILSLTFAVKIRQEAQTDAEVGSLPSDQSVYLMQNLANAVYSVYANMMNFINQYGRDTGLCASFCRDNEPDDISACTIRCMFTRSVRFFGNIAEYGSIAAENLRQAASSAERGVDSHTIEEGNEYGYDFSYALSPDGGVGSGPLDDIDTGATYAMTNTDAPAEADQIEEDDSETNDDSSDLSSEDDVEEESDN